MSGGADHEEPWPRATTHTPAGMNSDPRPGSEGSSHSELFLPTTAPLRPPVVRALEVCIAVGVGGPG